MKVYSAEYNDCIYESAFGTISLHSTEEGAQKVIDKAKAKEVKVWKKMGYDSYPDYQQWRVRTIEVKE